MFLLCFQHLRYIGIPNLSEMIKRRGCSCTKEDFLPEDSFQSWTNYLNALKEIPTRFIDRVVARSQDYIELHEVKARSQNEMIKILTGWDLIWFGVGSLIGAGVFVLTGLEAKEHAGPAVVVSYLIAGASAMLSVLCYIEFAIEIPVAGNKRTYYFPRICISDTLSLRSFHIKMDKCITYLDMKVSKFLDFSFIHLRKCFDYSNY